MNISVRGDIGGVYINNERMDGHTFGELVQNKVKNLDAYDCINIIPCYSVDTTSTVSTSVAETFSATLKKPVVGYSGLAVGVRSPRFIKKADLMIQSGYDKDVLNYRLKKLTTRYQPFILKYDKFTTHKYDSSGSLMVNHPSIHQSID